MLATLVVSTTAFARYTGPLLKKTQSPGSMREELAAGLKCELFRDKLVLSKSVGGLELVEQRDITVDTDKLWDLVGKAKNGSFSEPRKIPTDALSLTYVAFQVLENDVVDTVLLEGPFNAWEQKTNLSREAEHLRNFLDYICQ